MMVQCNVIRQASPLPADSPGGDAQPIGARSWKLGHFMNQAEFESLVRLNNGWGGGSTVQGIQSFGGNSCSARDNVSRHLDVVIQALHGLSDAITHLTTIEPPVAAWPDA